MWMGYGCEFEQACRASGANPNDPELIPLRYKQTAKDKPAPNIDLPEGFADIFGLG